MATFEKDSWVWVTDPEECYLPAKVNAPFKAGSAGSVTFEDGTTKDLSDAESSACQQMDEESLGELSNMVHFNDLKDAVLLHNLRKRFKKNEIYTSVGSILVAVNPFKLLPVYTPEVLQSYIGGGADKQPPHCWSIASASYMRMVSERASQAVCISGESGAGKTESMKLILQFLAEASQKAAGSTAGEGQSIEQLILQANPVTEGFGNAKTLRNNNSSRFGKWTALTFSNQGSITGGYVVSYLLEKSRVVFQTPGERNYHAFYQVLAGSRNDSTLASDLGLSRNTETYHYLNQSGASTAHGIDDEKEFGQLMDALSSLGLSVEDQNALLRVVAAVLHCGNLTFQNKSELEDGAAVANKEELGEVVRLLKVDQEALHDALTSKNIGTRSIILIPFTLEQAADSRDVLGKALYGKLFDWLIKTINVSLAQNIGGNFTQAAKDQTIIGVLDIFGFESFKTNSFEQLCINYCNEKLQFHFNNHIFTLEQDEYKAEGIDVSAVTFKSNAPTLDLIEKKGEGILALLDEEIVVPKGSDNGFLSKVLQKFAKHEALLRPKPKELDAQLCFKIVHYAGEVSYNTTNFLEKNKDALLPGLETLVKASEDDFIKRMFEDPVEPAAEGAVAKKKAAPRRGGRGGKKKVKTLASLFKSQLDSLMGTINSCEPHFVRCMKPNAEKKGGIFTASMMMAQLSYAGVLEVCRIRQVGFPMRREFTPFIRRYGPVVSGGISDGRDGCKQLCDALQSKGILTANGWAIGQTKVFLRANDQTALDGARAAALEKFVVMIQSAARRCNVMTRGRLWKSTLTGIKDASKARNLDELKKCIGLSENLPNRGGHLTVVKEAKLLVQQLEEQQRFVSALRAAIDENDLSTLQSLVASAAEMPDFSPPELDEANRTIQRLHKQVTLRNALNEAVASKDKKKLDEALTEAEEAGMEDTSEYEVARSLLDTIEEHENILAELHDAVENGNLKNLNALLTSVIDLGMDESNKTIIEAKKMQAQLKGQHESKYLLKKAITVARDTREFEDLESAVEKAKSSGMSEDVEEFLSANNLLKELRQEAELRQKLEAALSSQDVKTISNVLDEIKTDGLKGATGLINEAKALLQRSQNEENVLKQIHTAMGTRNIANLSKAVAMAENLWPNTQGLPEIEAQLVKAKSMLENKGDQDDAQATLQKAMQAASQRCGVAELQILSTAIEQATAAKMDSDATFKEAKDLESILKQRMAAEEDLRNVLVQEGGTEQNELEQKLEVSYGLNLSSTNSDTVRQAEMALALLQRRMSVAPHLHGKDPNQALGEAVATRDPDSISLALMMVMRNGASLSDPHVSHAKTLVAQLIAERELLARLQALTQSAQGRGYLGVAQQLDAVLRKADGMGIEDPVVESARAACSMAEAGNAAMEKLKAAIKAKDVYRLEDALSVATQASIPAENFQMRTARSLYQSLYLSTKFDADLQQAMEDQNMVMLNNLVVNAMKMGLGGDHEKVKRAKTLVNTLEQQQKVQVQVEAAFSSKNPDLMKAALEKADKVELKSKSVMEMRKLVAGAGAIKSLLQNLSAAVQKRDLAQLSQLYDEAEKLGLNDDVVTDALVLKERLELVEQLTRDLNEQTEAVFTSPTRQNCADLMDVVAQAMQCNFVGPEIEKAREVVETAEKRLEAKEALDASVLASELSCSRTSGITARDITQLSAALQPANTSVIRDLLGPAQELLKRMQSQLAVQKLLAEGTSSKDLLQLRNALERAQELGLEIAAVQQARATVASLGGGGDVLNEIRRSKPPAQALEEWKKKVQAAEQLQFHFSHFEGIRVPEDFLVGVQKNRKRVQMQMLTFQPKPLHKSLTCLDSDLNSHARIVHQNILGFCGDVLMSFPLTLASALLEKGLSEPMVRDEIYMQLCKHLTANPTAKSILRGWQLMCFCVHTFPPSPAAELYLLNFLFAHQHDPQPMGGLVVYCKQKLQVIVNTGAVDTVPSTEQLDGLLPNRVQRAVRRGSMLVRQKQVQAYMIQQEVKVATTIVGSERAEQLQKELDEARAVFQHMISSDTLHRTLSFEQVFKCSVVHQQIEKGDLSVDALKALWDQAVTDPATGNNAMVDLGNDRVGFSGFLRFLSLCEQESDSNLARVYSASGRSGEGLAVLKTTLLGNMRATLTQAYKKHTGDTINASGMPANELEKLMQRSLLSRALKQRQDRESLAARGILREGTARSSALDGKMKKMMLGKALRKRSTRAELVDQGIFKTRSSTQLQMEQNVNKMKLGHALRKRSTRAELTAQGILVDQTGRQMDAERNMSKAMLNRRFSQRPALDQLAALGIYREDDSERLTLERQLISSQLNKTLARRMSKDQGQQQPQKEILDEDVLAVIFERLAGKTELLSLEKLRAWEEVQNQLRDKKMSEGELLQVFHESDSDKDGQITFFEFLLFLRALEERQQANAKPARRKSLMSIKRKGSLLENATSVGRNESLKGILLKKMRARPEVQQLRTKGIYRSHNASPAAALLERNLMTNRLKSSLERRASKDQLIAQGILKEHSSKQVQMQQNMQKTMLGRKLSNRPDRAQLESQGILKDQTARQASMEKNMAKAMLSRKLSHRPDQQQLENIGVYQKGSSANVALERSLIASQLTRALRRRPSREILEGKGILEEDEFAVMFNLISNEDELLSLEDLQSWDIVSEQLETGGLAADVLLKVFSEVDGDKDGKINFSQFLTVLELADILQKQSDEHTEDSAAEKLRKRRLFRQKQKRNKEKGEAGLAQESSLKSALLAKMRNRPELQQLTSSGILKAERPAAQLLERNLIAANLQRGLQSRRSEDDLMNSGILKATSAQQAQLQLGMNKAMLGKALSRRSSRAELTAQGIYKDASSSAVDLERNMQKALLGRKLSSRPDREQLKILGIYRQDSAAAIKLNTGLIQRKLSLSLESRPQQDALVAQGILTNATSKSTELERNMQKALLGRRLSNRPDREQLQNLGIYKQGDQKASSLERSLLGNQLNKHLGQRVQLDDLKRLGIYTEGTAQTGALERSLIEGQLNRALGRRQSRAEVQAAGILKKMDATSLEEDRQTISSQLNHALGRRQTHADLKMSGIIPDVLAVAFKQICSETETAKLAQLKGMKGLKDMLVGGGVNEEQLSKMFDEVDTDRDGEINFSEFLLLTQKVEVAGQTQSAAVTTSKQKAQTSLQDDSLGSILSRKIKARPSMMELMSTGVMKQEKSPAAAMLERNLIVNKLKNNLARRMSRDELSASGIYQDTSAHQKQMEQKMHSALLGRALARRSSRADLQAQGILSNQKSGQAAALERALLKNALKNQLKKRPSLADLESEGIYQKAADEYVVVLDEVLAVAIGFQCTSAELLEVCDQPAKE